MHAAAELLEHDAHVGQAESQSAQIGRHEDAEEAKLAESAPDLVRRPARVVEHPPHVGDRADLTHEAADGVAKRCTRLVEGSIAVWRLARSDVGIARKPERAISDDVLLNLGR